MTDLSTKQSLRKHALARRSLIEPREAQAAAQSVAAKARALVAKLAPPGAIVAAYWPIRGEVSTRALLDVLAKDGYRTALPVMTAAAKPLRFHLWSPGDELEAGSLGLSEPSETAPIVTPDIVFVPLAAFDMQGHRVGYGGGSFDATLAALRAGRKLTAIGLAYATQEVAHIPAEPHDQRLDYILTEDSLIEI